MSSRLAVAGVAVLLLLTVGAANVVVTAERTALNGEYVSDTLESGGVYESLTEEAQETIQSEIESFSPENSQQVPDGVDFSDLDARALADEAVSEPYVRSQANENVDRAFAYLHGDRSEPNLRIDTEPLQANVSAAVSEQVEAVDPAALLNDASFRVEGYEVDGSLAQEMYQSRAGYQAYRSDIRARTDPQEREEINSEAKAEARSRAQQATGQYNQQITQGTITIQEAVIDGLTDDRMTYEEFRNAYDAGRTQISDGAGQAAASEIDERVGGEITPSELADGELGSTLEDARGYVQLMDTLQLALPIAALLLIALLYGIARAWQPTANVVGKVFVTAGVFALVAVLVQSVLLGIVEDRVGSQLENNDVVGVDLVTSLVEGVFETLTIQSGLLVVTGLVLLGVVYADENGHLDGLKRSIGIEPTAAGGPAGRVQPRQQSPTQRQSPQEQPPIQGQPDRQPRQPTGRSIARQGPQTARSERGQPSGDTSEAQQPHEQPSDTTPDEQPSETSSEDQPPETPSDERTRGDTQNASSDDRQVQVSDDQSTPPEDEQQSAESSNASEHPEQETTETQPSAAETGDDVQDPADTESGSLDAWETTEESELSEDEQSE